MPRLRQSVQKIDQLDELPLDQDDQDELLALLKMDNYQTNRLFINIFTVIFLIPLPLFIHVKYFRSQPTTSFLSIVSLVLSVIKLRYLHLIDFSSFESPIVQKVQILFNPWLYNVLNVVIASGVVLQRVQFGMLSLNILYFVPIIGSISSIFIMHWIFGLDNDIDGLNKLKYKYKSS